MELLRNSSRSCLLASTLAHTYFCIPKYTIWELTCLSRNTAWQGQATIYSSLLLNHPTGEEVENSFEMCQTQLKLACTPQQFKFFSFKSMESKTIKNSLLKPQWRFHLGVVSYRPKFVAVLGPKICFRRNQEKRQKSFLFYFLSPEN